MDIRFPLFSIAGFVALAGCGAGVVVPTGGGDTGGTADGGGDGSGANGGSGTGANGGAGSGANGGAGGAGAGGAGGAVTTGGAGGTLATCSSNAVLTGDVFDPGEVYLAGTLSEGARWLDAMAHWSSPGSAAIAFDCYFDNSSAQIRPTDGRLVYTNTFEYLLREFHCDGCPYSGNYPDVYLDNDAVLPTAPCDDQYKLGAFLLSPEGGRVHQCWQSNDWYDETGKSVYSDPDDLLVHLGHGDLALTTTRVVHLASGASSPIVGLPDRPVLTVRAEAPDRFLLALAVEEMAPGAPVADLWSVDAAGAATLVGVYPSLPAGAQWAELYSAKLDGCGGLVFFASGPEVFQDIIVRLDLSGSSQIVFDEATEPLVKIHISALVTGP